MRKIIEFLKSYFQRVRQFYGLQDKEKIILRQNKDGTNEIELNNIKQYEELKQIKR